VVVVDAEAEVGARVLQPLLGDQAAPFGVVQEDVVVMGLSTSLRSAATTSLTPSSLTPRAECHVVDSGAVVLRIEGCLLMQMSLFKRNAIG
jgi:hypothetical protein